MKKIIALLLSLLMVFGLCSCGEKKENKAIRVGIIQYMSHPSLDNCYKGIKEALDNSGLNIETDLQVGASTSAESDCTNFANNMVAEGYDMIMAIATPAAKSAFAATDDTDIPVVFCAVNDPIAAGIVKDMNKPGYACSGTSDVLDLEGQVKLIKSVQPDVKKIGVIYTSSEDNSVASLKRFEEVCKGHGIEVISSAVQNASDVPSAAEAIASKVDCINNFTDNNVVNNLSVVLSAADKYNIPVYGSEEEQVKKGCIASVSIDYVALGKVTGEMAVEALNGKDLAEMPVKTISEATPIINKEVFSKLKLELPKGYDNIQTVNEK